MVKSSASSHDRIRFGGFEVDLRGAELRKHGVRVRVQEQPFKILTALLEKPGKVVTREELRRRIWGESTFVEFDHGLNAAVNRLRDALCDSAEAPKYVETVARQGYRFIAEVEGPTAAEQDTSAPGRWVPLAAAALLTAAVVVGIRWKASRVDLGPMQVAQLTALVGRELQPSFSPDGRQVAFVWGAEGKANTDVYVKVVGSADAPLRLTSDPAPDSSPAWSPDGNRIAFLRAHGERSDVYLVSPLGGGERKLTEIRPGMFPRVAWSPHGKVLVMAEVEPAAANSILAFDVGSGRKWRLTESRQSFHVSPAVSPDGKYLAYAEHQGTYVSDVHVLELRPDTTSKGRPRQLTRQGVNITGLAWAGDGRSIIYAASHNAGLETHLWRMAAVGTGEPERLELAGPRATQPAVATSGDRLAYTQGLTDRDIWKWEVGGTAASFIASSLLDYNASFSPNGERIAFSSNRTGNGTEIFVCSRDGSDPIQLTNGAGRHMGSPHWSADSRQIIFDGQGDDGRWDIYSIDAVGGRPRRMTEGKFDESAPSFSRDGRWIYLASNRSGRNEIWRMPANGGDATQLTTCGATSAVESWDGKTLYYQNWSAAQLGLHPVMAMPVDGGHARLVVEGVTPRGFVPAPGGIYHLGPVAGEQVYALKFYDFVSKKSTQMTRVDVRPAIGLTVSPNLKTFLFTIQKPANYDLMIIENFR